MPQFNKRGNRIRASDKSLVFRFSAGLLLPLFFVVVLLLNLKTILTTDWKSVSFLKDGSVHLTVTSYMIVTVIVSALFCAIAALLYQRFQYDRVKQLFHRQKLARMLLENGWYESKTIQNSRFFTLKKDIRVILNVFQDIFHKSYRNQTIFCEEIVHIQHWF